MSTNQGTFDLPVNGNEGGLGQSSQTRLKIAYKNAPYHSTTELAPPITRATEKTKFGNYACLLAEPSTGLTHGNPDFATVSLVYSDNNVPASIDVPICSTLPYEAGRPSLSYGPDVSSPTVPQGSVFTGPSQKPIEGSAGSLSTTPPTFPDVTARYLKAVDRIDGLVLKQGPATTGGTPVGED
jgi:hypothetical protein